MKTIVLFDKVAGLNNVDAPTRMVYDPSNSIINLAEAVNIDVDNTGRPKRRCGFTATTRTESSHSMFTGRTGTYFIAGTVMYRLNGDATRTSIATGIVADLPMYYIEVLDTIYFANGLQKGTLVNGVYTDWSVGTYYGPTTHRQFSAPPTGTILEVYNGTMFIVVKNVLWYSERFGMNLFDLARNFIWFEDDITMVVAVKDGLYVSTTKKVVFLQGSYPDEFKQFHVSDQPAVPGTAVKVNAEDVESGNVSAFKSSMSGKGVIWTTLSGIYFGHEGGESKCLTGNRIKLPSVSSGCAAFHDGRYLVTFNN